MKKIYLPIIICIACLSLALTVSKEKKNSKLKVSVFNGGSIVCGNLEYFTHDGAYKNESKTLSNSVFLIQHPKGNLLWDTGISDSYLADSTEKPSYESFNPQIQKTLAQQFDDAKIEMENIDFLSLSHTHFDHIGNVSYFNKSIWLVQQDELKWAFSKYDKHERDLISSLKSSEKIVFDKQYDVFGDGTVVIFHFPGHTPGHSILYIEDGKEKYLIAGDMYHFIEQRNHKRIPQFNYNIQSSRLSMVRFENLVDSLKAKVIIQHESNFPKNWDLKYTQNEK